jgi:hypothetical protein
MGLKNVTQPRLPAAPVEYDARYMEQLINVLRLYFSQLDNASLRLVFASSERGAHQMSSYFRFNDFCPA